VAAALGKQRRLPDLRFVSNYHDAEGYLDVLAASVAEHWLTEGTTQHLLVSFHGVPERYVQQGDPYREQCLRTAELLTQRLRLAPDAWSVSFQSRFGRAQWLTPYTSEVLAELPTRGVKNVSVVCPGFAADCLETLEEIGMENRDVFLAAGGTKYQYIPALNARPDHVEALRELVFEQARGWMDGAGGAPREAA
jgi:protoporphyrin/coproporphyrin ferrochelatase